MDYPPLGSIDHETKHGISNFEIGLMNMDNLEYKKPMKHVAGQKRLKNNASLQMLGDDSPPIKVVRN